MAGPVQPVIFPVMWARDASSSFLRTPPAMRAVMEAAGFRVRVWDDVTAETAGPGTTGGKPPPLSARLIQGEGPGEDVPARPPQRRHGRTRSRHGDLLCA